MSKSTYSGTHGRVESLARMTAEARAVIVVAVGRAMREVLPFTAMEQVDISQCLDDGPDVVRVEIVCRCTARYMELTLEPLRDMEGMVESQMSVALAELFDTAVWVRRVTVTEDGPMSLRCAGSFIVVG